MILQTMKDPRNELLSTFLSDIVAQLQLGVATDKAWEDANRAHSGTRDEEDVELFVALDERDLSALRTIVQGWASGARTLIRHDRDVLKRALKAFRKRLKIVRLDSESSVGGGPTSSGRQSSIVGVRAPEQYPQEVWDELVRQERIIDGRGGIYELPPE